MEAILEPVFGITRLPHLNPRAELAILARALHRAGYDDEGLGHLSYRQPDGTLLVNPFELGWDEILPGDVMQIDLDGAVVAGQWTVSPAIRLHLELHAARSDACVAIHNHPQWGTVWADVAAKPPIYDQTSAVVGDDLVIHDEYDGSVVDVANSAAAIRALGDSSSMLLAHHGVLVVGASVQDAHLRAMTLEWRCRQGWRVQALGLPATPLSERTVEHVRGEVAAGRRAPIWEMTVRREQRAEPLLVS